MKLSAASPQISREPVEIRFEPAGGEHHGLRRDGLDPAVDRHRHRSKPAVREVEADDGGVVQHADAHAGRGRVVAVHQRLAAAEKMDVGAIEMQRALERRLQPDSEPLHPAGAGGGPSHDQAGQRFVRAPAGHADQVRNVFVFGIRAGQQRRRRVVHRPQVPRVAAVAAAKGSRRALDHDHGRPALPGAQGRAQAGVAAAEHRDVERLSQSSP